MDGVPSVRKKRGTKQAKPKKKTPIKVVYISNPMKFTASPSEFRALVQELTGQDSDVADVSKFSDTDGGDALQSVPHRGTGVADIPSAKTPTPAPSKDSDHRESSTSGDSPFDLLDDVFTPLLLENIISGFLPSGPSGIVYEAQVDLHRSLDAV